MATLIGMPKGITEEQLAKVEEVIEAFKPEAEEVMATKPGFSTTQNDYGWYMTIIAIIPDNSVMRLCWINALLRADANPKGIQSALQLMS